MSIANCTADRETAREGETVTVTPLLPEGALLSDYNIRWSSTPRVAFTAGGDAAAGQRQFTMPDANVAVTCTVELKTYAVRAYNCTADKANAARGETVAATAAGELDPEAEMFAWTHSPAVEFTRVDERTIAFVMPAERIMVTARMQARAYPVTAAGCAADRAEAPRGATVTLTALLPEGALAAGYDFEWSSTPAVEFTEGEGTASFTMPAAAVSVTCTATEKPPQDSATLRVLHLEAGWNLVMLSLVPDEESQAKLRAYPAMALDPLNHMYVRARELTADGLFWLYAAEPARLVVTGEAATMAPPREGHDWQPYGTFPSVMLVGFELWQWLDGILQSPSEPQIVPGRGYFIRRRK